MIKTSPNTSVPKVGQILYKEERSDKDEFMYASLIFIDEEIQEGNQWMYTQIAHMEDFGKGMEVYLHCEAGGMPHEFTRLATDEDIKKFVTLMKDGSISEGSPNLKEWIKRIRNDGVLLNEEKERIERIVNSTH